MPDIGPNATEVDVLIVGAGVAGLHAARLLQSESTSPTVAIVEGRSRSGGRLLSPRSGLGVIDLGATWYWPNEPLVTALVARECLANFPQYDDGDMMYQPDSSSQRVRGNQLASSALRLTGGTQSITNALAEHLPPDAIHFDDPARQIHADGTRSALIVTCDRTSWRAQHVIVAVPPATAITHIDFGNNLDESIAQLASLTPVWMGATVKVVARYDGPFWRNEGLAGAAVSHTGPMREIHDMSGPGGSAAALFGFAQPGAGTEAPSTDQALDQLVAIFGPKASNATDVIVQDWRNESFTSPPAVESLTRYDTFGHDLYQQAHIGGRLHWASTETARQAPGHIEGALAAATRAAQNVISTLASAP